MQHLLRKLEVPKKLKGPENEDEDYESMEKAAVDFVERYGAYLELNRCLVKAGEVESDNVVRVLLSMAKKDKIHQAAMKEISKANVLVLYESVSTSACPYNRKEVHVDHLLLFKRQAANKRCHNNFTPFH